MATDLDAYRDESLASWDEVATGWEDRRAWLAEITRPLSEWLVEALDPQPGQTILDIASGTGDLGFAVAERAGRVLMTDFAPEMVDVAKRNGQMRGATNVEHRVLDAEEMDLADGSVDGALCRWGYMLMADPAAALRETHRVLRGRGRLAAAVWTTPERNPWASTVGVTLVQRGAIPPPDPTAPGIFALGDESKLRGLVESAGFAAPTIDEIRFDFRYADFEDFWDAIVRLAGPLARVINAMPDAEEASLRDELETKIEQFKQDGGAYSVPASCWAISATR